ncbi:MAG TPA: histidine phosphatase family protein [Candidatus Binataceae bacterium]|nr:histidine phosphatase family protein [Candidatus Binataceae bacterium]
MRRLPDLTLVLVRHGETEGESSIRYHGRNDVKLSELGRAQMIATRRELESRFTNPGFHHVFTTPLSRAFESARLIAGDDVAIVKVEDFIEVHFGLFEGLTADEIRERHPIEFEKWNADRLAPSYTYPQGESRAAFAQRVEYGLEKTLQMIDSDDSSESVRVLIVAHRGVIRAIVRSLTGAEPIVELGSIQILARDSRWHPLVLDLTAHLATI